MLDTLPSQLGFALAVCVAGFAFLKGDEPERVGAGAYMLAILAAVVSQDRSALYGVQWNQLVIDAALVLVFAGVAWKSRRVWPVWACALQGLIVMVHLLAGVDQRPPLAAFYAVINLAGLGVLLALGLGTWTAWRDRRAVGLP